MSVEQLLGFTRCPGTELIDAIQIFGCDLTRLLWYARYVPGKDLRCNWFI
jgi:hypothetical protein